MRLSEGDELDDALELFHNHSWVEQKPQISAEQMAELVPVLAPLWQRSRPRVRAERPKQKVQNRATPKVDKGSEARGRRLVYARSGGVCEAGLGGVCAVRAREWHHRKARSLGGRWDASNGMHACQKCHQWIGEHPLEAAKRGWYLTAREEPSVVPVKRFGDWVLLDDEGGWTAVEEVA